MLFRLKIQSTSDVITNSSSELFQLKSDLAFDTVKEIIETEGRKNFDERPACFDSFSLEEQKEYDDWSGDGGDLTLRNWEDVFHDHADWCCVKSKRDQYTPEIWALGYEESLDELKSMVWVSIDHSRKATIKFILENFWVTSVDTWGHYYQKDPKTGNLIRVITKEMYDALPEDCREKHIR